MAVIEVRDLVKEYNVVKKQQGLKAAVVSLFKKDVTRLRAVDGISFSIEKGEIVGYLGPNGAGKSTTIKMMSGILTPTAGKILINGLEPHRDRKKVVMDLGVVFGQRTQLYWDLRLGESFELLKRIYKVSDELFRRNMDMLNEILAIHELVDTPVRQLSLGQRMRGDLAAAILHSPGILFLDEPTIGLDVEVKHAIRRFIRDINQNSQTTIILTTHDLDDIQELCSRIIIINHGKIVEDGSLDALIGKIAPLRRLTVEFYGDAPELKYEKARVIKTAGSAVTLEFDKRETSASELVKDLFQLYQVKDISVEEANIEDIIRKVYSDT